MRAQNIFDIALFDSTPVASIPNKLIQSDSIRKITGHMTNDKSRIAFSPFAPSPGERVKKAIF
jgi:hypothetical protein